MLKYHRLKHFQKIISILFYAVAENYPNNRGIQELVKHDREKVEKSPQFIDRLMKVPGIQDLMAKAEKEQTTLKSYNEKKELNKNENHQQSSLK